MQTSIEPNPRFDQSLASLAFRLEGRNRILYEELLRKDERLGNIYFGARMVMGQHENPTRISMSAHEFRELMDKIPQYIDIDVPNQAPHLGAEVNTLRGKWERTRNKSTCFSREGWEGNIDNSLRILLRYIDEFFIRTDKIKPVRKERTARVVRHFDPSNIQLPPSLENQRITNWDDVHNYFVRVAHHQESEVSKFEEWVDRLERTLMDMLRPRTFDDYDEIDQIIGEGERDDQA